MKTAWVIMKETTIPTVHMIGFRSKKEAVNQCNLLNERSVLMNYFITKANVFQPWEP